LTGGTDASATIHNPANLMDLEEPTVMSAFTIGFMEIDYTGPLGRVSSEDPLRILPGVFANWDVGEDMRAGVAVHVPYGQFTTWPQSSALALVAPYHAELRSVNLSPALAMALSEEVSLGVGLDLMWSQLIIKQQLPWGAMMSNPALGVGRATLDGDGFGVGAHVGLTWSIDEGQRLSLVYQSGKSIEYDGSLDIENLPPGAVPLSPSSSMTTEIEFPAVLAAAYGVQVQEELHVEIQVEWVEHSCFESLAIDAGNNTPLLVAAYGSASLPQNWEDTWTVSVGCDWNVSDKWVVRGGVAYLPTPVPETTLMPQFPEGDKYVVGLGAGYHKGGSRLDVAYGFSIADDVTVSPLVNPVSGTYEFEQHILSISYSCTL
jgi:long-chain fatty acid transport protein